MTIDLVFKLQQGDNSVYSDIRKELEGIYGYGIKRAKYYFPNPNTYEIKVDIESQLYEGLLSYKDGNLLWHVKRHLENYIAGECSKTKKKKRKLLYSFSDLNIIEMEEQFSAYIKYDENYDDIIMAKDMMKEIDKSLKTKFNKTEAKVYKYMIATNLSYSEIARQIGISREYVNQSKRKLSKEINRILKEYKQ